MKKFLTLFCLIIVAGCTSVFPPVPEKNYIYKPIDLSQGISHKITFTPRYKHFVRFELKKVEHHKLIFNWKVTSPAGVIVKQGAYSSAREPNFVEGFYPLANILYTLQIDVTESNKNRNHADAHLKIYAPEHMKWK